MTEKKKARQAGFISFQLRNARANYLRLLLPLYGLKNAEPSVAGYFMPKFLLRIALFSLLLFAVSFLMVKVLSVLALSAALRFYEINFENTLLNIHFLPGDESRWNDGKMLLVFGLPPLLFMLFGMLITLLLYKIKLINWLIRLFLTWLSFALVVHFISEMLMAIFFYRSFGIAMLWLINNFWLRLLVVLAFTAIVVFWAKSYGILFLKCSTTRIYLDELPYRHTFLVWIFLLPMAGGFLYLSSAFLLGQKIMIFFSLIAGIMIFPIAFRASDYLANIRINKSNKKVPSLALSLLLLLVLAILIRFM